MNFAKRFFHFAAILAVFMQLGAHLTPVLAAATGATQITICSGISIRTITIDKRGNEIPPIQNTRTRDCSICSVAKAFALEVHDVRISTQPHGLLIHDEAKQERIYKFTRAKSNLTRAPPAQS